MTVSKEQKAAEAMARMEICGLRSSIISEFKDNGILYVSQDGDIRELSEEGEELISCFEQEYDARVYHLVVKDFKSGKLVALLFVSDNKKEWSMDRTDLKNYMPLAYVVNLGDPTSSEFGTIKLENVCGALRRVW